MFVGIEPAQDPLPPKEWNAHLEALLNTGQMNPDIIPFLNHRQAWCMNEIKKAFDRFQRRSTPFIPETKYNIKNDL